MTDVVGLRVPEVAFAVYGIRSARSSARSNRIGPIVPLAAGRHCTSDPSQLPRFENDDGVETDHLEFPVEHGRIRITDRVGQVGIGSDVDRDRGWRPTL